MKTLIDISICRYASKQVIFNNVNDYVAFKFEEKWLIGKIVRNNIEELSAEISLLKPLETDDP